MFAFSILTRRCHVVRTVLHGTHRSLATSAEDTAVWQRPFGGSVTRPDFAEYAERVKVRNEAQTAQEAPHPRTPTSVDKLDLSALAAFAQCTPQARNAAWNALGLPSHLFMRLPSLKCGPPTAIQAAAVPKIMQTKNEGVFLQAETGSGKTLAYLLPLLAMVENKQNFTQAVVVVPTRELANQIFRLACRLGGGGSQKRKANPMRIEMLRGFSVEEHRQHPDAPAPHVIISCPEALSRCLSSGVVRLDRLKALAIDEIDAILDNNAQSALETIVSRSSKNAQLILSSATITRPCIKFGRKFRPQMEFAIPRNRILNKADANEAEEIVPFTLPTTITHIALQSPEGDEEKAQVISKIHAVIQPKGTFVFVNSADKIDIITRHLIRRNFRVSALFSGSSNEERQAIMQKLGVVGGLQVVVCTEMAARGLDLPLLNLVINFDLPETPLKYLHRAGRVSRLRVSKMKPGQALQKRLGLAVDETEVSTVASQVAPDPSGGLAMVHSFVEHGHVVTLAPPNSSVLSTLEKWSTYLYFPLQHKRLQNGQFVDLVEGEKEELDINERVSV